MTPRDQARGSTSRDEHAESEGQRERSGSGNLPGVLYAGIWLVFLALPGTAAVVRGAHPTWIVVALAAIVAFAIVYIVLMARWMPLAESGERIPVRSMVLALLGLSVLAALCIPAAGSYTTAFTTYLAALVIFSYPPRAGIPVGILIWLVPSSLGAVFAGGSGVAWALFGPGIGLVFIVVIRVTEIYEERDRRRQESLRQSAERDAIARDVHDVLGHSLTVLSIKAQLAGKLLTADPERAARELEQIDELARESLSRIRSTVSRLRSPELRTEVEVARAALRAAEIEADIVVAAGPPAPADESHLFAWVLREGVTNVVRHSGATRCRIEIHPARLRIADDGVGTDPAREGNGLRGLRERTRTEHARLSIGPAPAADAAAANGRPGTMIEVTR